ncbi:MAG: hypothetical protein LBR69_01245 [Endomicrobium sp.]|nr:hypothetical protein [Endomicrobium sp.]
MSHKLIKATLAVETVKLIAKKYGVSPEEALDMFYKSSTAVSLDDESTGLYGRSALYIFSLFENEKSFS